MQAYVGKVQRWTFLHRRKTLNGKKPEGKGDSPSGYREAFVVPFSDKLDEQIYKGLSVLVVWNP